MLRLCSINLSKSPYPTPLLSPKLAAFGFNHRSPSNRLESRKGFCKGQFFLTNVKGIHSSDKSILGNSSRECFLVSCFTRSGTPMQELNVAEKVQCLASEFKSLPEPVDRVKRLLYYATLLPPFDELARVQENRVTGCTTLVWLEVEMDNNRLMRFRVDSDSEITKGFASCLIWLFDGAAPEEVLSVKSDDLLEMNVGFPSRGRSRVNTWHNILIAMQKRTQNLVEESYRKHSFKAFPPFVIRPDAINVNGSYKEAQWCLQLKSGLMDIGCQVIAKASLWLLVQSILQFSAVLKWLDINRVLSSSPMETSGKAKLFSSSCRNHRSTYSTRIGQRILRGPLTIQRKYHPYESLLCWMLWSQGKDGSL